MPQKYICIHGHFYQPPRENPWLEEIELQESAYPYHDWNERITRECYAPNAASRILDGDNKIIEIINSYKRISFNFGPTLLTWLERKAPETYKAILHADTEAGERFSGHGPAIAQCYNHMIMPLANARDKRTQIRWGLRDFEFRFGRKPEGMWLPETAVDTETLDMLAEEGIAFTILAQRQCKAVRRTGRKKWQETPEGRVEPRRSYLYHLPSGRRIALFFYDGAVAHDVSFGNLLANGENFAKRLFGCFREEKLSAPEAKDKKDEKEPEEPVENREPAQLVHIATDGETYGHHHGMGDMALAYCLNHIDKNEFAGLTVYGEFLKKHPPEYEAQIFENSSWSCVHGVERWRADCGCHIGGGPDWNQKWRKPLREALDWLRDRLAEVYEQEGGIFFGDVWTARERYIDVILDRSQESVENFLSRETGRFLTTGEMVKALKLMEMQRQAMLMYTSCGWFFDDISGIETVQVLRYAACAMQMAAETAGVFFEEEFLKRLEAAPGNIPEHGNGAEVYEKYVRPSILTLMRVGAHHAIAALFEKRPETVEIYSYTVNIERFERLESERNRMVTGVLRIRSKITTEEKRLNFAVLHTGDENLAAGVSEIREEKDFMRPLPDLKNLFKKNDMESAARMIGEQFENTYSLKDLLRDEQSRVLYSVLDANLEKIEGSLREINRHRGPIVRVLKELRVPLPKVLAHTVSLMFAKDLLDALSSDTPDLERLRKLINEVMEFTLEIDKETISFVVRQKIEGLMDTVYRNSSEPAVLERTAEFLEAVAPLKLQFDLWKTQNLFFEVRDNIYQNIRARADSGDTQARRWLEQFKRLGENLKVKIE